MTVLVVAIYVVAGLTALLGLYGTLRDLPADLVLLGGCALVLLLWAAESIVLAVRDATGGVVPDAITLYGYLATGIALPVAGIWLGIGERSRWGSAAIAVIAVTMLVLQLRLPQIWPGGF